jgi:hypothetical protein
MHKTHYLVALAAACSFASTASAFGAQQPNWGQERATNVGPAVIWLAPPTGEISGRVTSGRGTPLYAAHIDITDHGTGQSFSTLTREDGRYAVFGLTLGHEYDVMIREIGYAPLHRVVDMPPPPANDADPVADPVVDGVLLPIDVPTSTNELRSGSQRATVSMG